MRELIDTALTFWRNRPRHEQHLLTGLAVCLLITAWIFGVYRPVAGAKSVQITRIERAETARFKLEQLPPQTMLVDAPAIQPLQAQITQSARQANLDILRIETLSYGLEVEFDSVPYSDFIRWLDNIHAAQRVEIISLRMNRRPSPGQVSVSLVLGGS